ncbi:MAG: tetratricopeptide repeat protein, partial [Proteobacteria bacterium]|nr:tetratricopeptide repeat protein [Pseudomonadota bacterium]
DKAVRCCDRLLVLDALAVPEYRDRGACYLRLGHVSGAREDWQRYLALMPQAADAEEIALKLAELGSATPSLN